MASQGDRPVEHIHARLRSRLGDMATREALPIGLALLSVDGPNRRRSEAAASDRPGSVAASDAIVREGTRIGIRNGPLAAGSPLTDRFRMCVRQCVLARGADADAIARLERHAREARRARAAPEHIVLTIRLAWYEAPGAWVPSDGRGQLLKELVERALDAYFDSPRWFSRHAAPWTEAGQARAAAARRVATP